MSPPPKRRRLTLANEPDTTACGDDVETVRSVHSAGYSHGVEHLPHASHLHTSAHLRPVPQRMHEVHLQLQPRAVEVPEKRRLRPRQGITASAGVSGVSIEASVDLSGSMTTLITSTDSASGLQPSAATSTSSIGTASGGASSSNSSGSASSSASASSDTLSASSRLSNSSSSSSAAVSGLASNGLGTTGTAPTSTTSSNSTGTNTTPSVTLTTSAIVLVGNGTTTTSQATIDLATGSSGSITTSSASSSSNGAFVYLATLGDGNIETITRQSSSYVTTFSDDVTSTISPYLSDSNSAATSTMLQTTTMSESSYPQSTITATTDVAGAGGGSPTTPAASASTSPSMDSGGGGGGISSATTGAIAGGVVGGCAGVALLLVAALLLLKWWKRHKINGGHQALPANTGMLADDEHPTDFPRGPGMAERAGLMPAAFGAVPAFFRHQNRSAAPSESEPAERGFARISGRKLPSNFSPGMTGPPPDMPLSRSERNLSGGPFDRDSDPFHGGEGSSPERTSPVGAGAMTLSPGPQRTPTVHAGGPYTLSSSNTASSPRSPPGTAGTNATFARSDTPSTLDPNRSSRFQENVDI